MVQIDIACFFNLFDTYCRAFRLFYDVAEILNSHGSEPAGRDLSLAQCSHQLSYSVFIDQRFLFFYRNHLLDFYTWKMVSRSPKIQVWPENRNDILIFLHAAHRFLCDSICIYLRDCQNLPTKYFMFLSRASARWSSLSGHEVWQNAEYLTWVTVSLADFYLTITLSSILLWRLGSWL